MAPPEVRSQSLGTRNNLDCIACQVTLLSLFGQLRVRLGFPRQEYYSRLPFSSPGDLPESGIEPTSPALAGRFFTVEPPGKLQLILLDSNLV